MFDARFKTAFYVSAFIPLAFGCLFWGAEFFAWESAWEFDRFAIAQGEWWRLFTANLVHISWAHLFFDYAGFVVIWYLFQRQTTFWQWLWVISISAWAVGLGLWWFNVQLLYYLGISGVLHGMFVFGAMRTMRKDKIFAAFALFLIITKLLWEQTQGTLSNPEMVGAPVIVDAHLYGALGGLAAWIMLMLSAQLLRITGQKVRSG
jgi:rhomboid family GlyGly-CTERM serine protease